MVQRVAALDTSTITITTITTISSCCGSAGQPCSTSQYTWGHPEARMAAKLLQLSSLRVHCATIQPSGSLGLRVQLFSLMVQCVAHRGDQIRILLFKIESGSELQVLACRRILTWETKISSSVTHGRPWPTCGYVSMLVAAQGARCAPSRRNYFRELREAALYSDLHE